jgi:hypothetical protein
MTKVRFTAFAAAIICGLGTVSYAAAPPPPPAAKDDPAKVAAAREFIVVYHPRSDPKNVKAMVDAGIGRAVANAVKLDPKLDPKKYENDLRARVMGNAERSLDLQSHVVSRHFTLPELKALAAFYSSPLARKLDAQNAIITHEVKVGMMRSRGSIKPVMIGRPYEPPPANPPKPAPHK